jgi:hypothetical protein
MNAIGFSKSEREMHRHNIHLLNILNNIYQTIDQSEGMCGSVCFNNIHLDYDFLLTTRYIMLYTPRTNNINDLLLTVTAT